METLAARTRSSVIQVMCESLPRFLNLTKHQKINPLSGL
jgi:hypothetical protein